MAHPLVGYLTRFGTWLASPIAFPVVALYAACWAWFDWNAFDWQAVATLATWLMTLLIARAENRDTQAIHAKLDELLRAHGDARNELMTIDQQEPEDILAHRAREGRDLGRDLGHMR
jgi:low affinity Fe/Cu permease